MARIVVTCEAEVSKAIDGLKSLNKQYQTLADRGNKLSKEEKDLFDSVNRDIANQTAELIKYWKTYDVGSKSTNELKRTQKDLAAILRTLDPKCTEWKDLTEAYQNVSKAQKELQGKLKETDATLGELDNSVEKTVSTWKKFGQFIVPFNALLSATSKVKGKLQELTQDFLVYSDLMADVQKTTGLSAKEVEALGESFKKIDTRSSRNELMELAATAGKLGISAREDVEAFVRAADVINVALGEDLGEGALREIGKMADVFGLTKNLGIEQAYLKIGSAINSLGASSTAAEGYLVDFTQRMAGVGSQAGLTIDQVLAYGSAFDQSGQKTEMAATAFQGFIVKMLEDSDKFARIAGADIEEFKDLLQNDVNGAIKLVLQSLHKTGEEGFAKLIPIFDEMHLDGNRAVQALSALAKNVSALEKAEVDSAKAFDEGNSAIEEFNTKNNNAAAQVEKMQNRLETIRQEIGQQLVPILLKVSSGFNGFLGILGQFAKMLPKSTVGIVAFVATLGSIALTRVKTTVSITSMRTAFTAFKGTVDKATTAVKRFFQAFANNPFGWIIAGLTTVVTIVSEVVRKNREAQREASAAFREFSAGMNKELDAMNAMLAVLKTAGKETEDYATAKQAVIDQYGSYLQGLINEEGELGKIADVQERITAAIKDRWATDAENKMIGAKQDEIYGKQGDITQSLLEMLPDNGMKNYNLAKLQNFEGKAVEKNANVYTGPYSTATQSALKVSGDMEALLESMGVPKELFEDIALKVDRYQKLSKELTDFTTATKQKFASYHADFEDNSSIEGLEAQITQTRGKISTAKVQKNAIITNRAVTGVKPYNSLTIEGTDTEAINKEIAQYETHVQELEAQLAALKEEIKKKNEKKTKTGGGTPDPDVKAEMIQEENRRLMEATDEMLAESYSKKKTANEKEIEDVEKKYDTLINKEKAFQLKMEKVKANKNSSPEEKAAAQTAIDESKQRETSLGADKTRAVQQVRLRQLKEANKAAEDQYEKLLQDGFKALKTANELELAEVYDKYNKEVEAAKKAVDEAEAELQRLQFDPDATPEARKIAQTVADRANDILNAALQNRDDAVERTKTQQQQRTWDAWNDAKNQTYSGKENIQRNHDIKEKQINEWEQNQKATVKLQFEALGLTDEMDGYAEEYQNFQNLLTAIEADANQQRLQNNIETEKAKMDNAMQGIQMLQQALSAASNAMSDIKQMELDKANAQYEKDKANLDKQLKKKQISQATYNKKMEALTEEKEAKEKEIRKKYQLAEFLMTIAQIGAQTALAIMATIASSGGPLTPLGIASVALTSAMGAVQIGMAAAQYNAAKGYKTGGYTGEGGVSEPAGIVHKGEYVVPQWVLRTPKGMNYVGVLEAIRTNKTTGYAGGGYVPGAARSTGSVSGSADKNDQTAKTTTAVSGNATFTPAQAAELLTLTRSIDQKLNGVSLVYLKSQLNELQDKYDNVEKTWGFAYPQ